MRLLFCSRPAYGHLYPMMPLARAAGHEVAFATRGRFVAVLRSLVDADVLVALGSAPTGALERVPANVHVEAFVDQAAVLRHADLVVHHGGSGTVLGALAHGRRQLLLPKGADQFLNADALRASGMAQVLEPVAATEQAIATAARAALAAPVPAAVLGARAEIAAMPAPDAALAALLDRLVEHR